MTGTWKQPPFPKGTARCQSRFCLFRVSFHFLNQPRKAENVFTASAVSARRGMGVRVDPPAGVIIARNGCHVGTPAASRPTRLRHPKGITYQGSSSHARPRPQGLCLPRADLPSCLLCGTWARGPSRGVPSRWTSVSQTRPPPSLLCYPADLMEVDLVTRLLPSIFLAFHQRLLFGPVPNIVEVPEDLIWSGKLKFPTSYDFKKRKNMDANPNIYTAVIL